MNISNNYRKDIDALRGLAILLVIIFHAFPQKLTGGFVGVDVFFVISGFLITSIITKQIHSNEFSFLSFYKRRILRIFPALLFVLVSSLIIGWLILFPEEFKQLGQHVFRSILFTQNFNLIDEIGYFDVSSYYKPLLHLWTLSVEAQYYLLWPVILIIIFRLRLDAVKVLIVMICISFITNLCLVEDYKNEVFFHSVTRFWELGAGSLLAIARQDSINKYSKVSRLSIFILGIVTILLSSFFIKSDDMYPSWIALFPITGSILLIYSNINFKKYGGLVYLGLISYPLYLWHWVLISFAYIYIGENPSFPMMLSIIVFSIILSWLTYKYIERIRFSKSNRSTLWLLAVAVICGLAGLYIEKAEGVKSRTHLSYIDEYNIQFERTPAVDEICDSYVVARLNEERLFDYCRSHEVGKNNKVVAIIGDSHAHALFPGIAKKAHERGYGTLLFANSSCPPLIGFESGKNKKDISECQLKIKQIIKLLSLIKEIKIVVFSTRGPVYIHGEVKGEFTEESVNESLNLIKKEELSYVNYFDGFDNTLKSISNIQHIKKIYYFLENPELDFLPKEVIPRPFDYFGLSTRDSTMDYSLYKLRMDKYQTIAYKISDNYEKVSVIDTTPYFCDQKKCYSYKNGNFLYADDDHLSVFGSHYIASEVEDVIFNNEPPNRGRTPHY